MKLITKAEVFLKAMKEALKPEKRSTIPVLGCAKINADNPSITTTDLDCTTTIGIDDADGNGVFLIPYYSVFNVLNGEKGPLTIESIPGPASLVAAPNTRGHNSRDCGCERKWEQGAGPNGAYGYIYTCGHVDRDDDGPESVPVMQFDEWLNVVETTLGKQLWEADDDDGRSSLLAALAYRRGFAPEWFANPKSITRGDPHVKVNVSGCEYSFPSMRLDFFPVPSEVDGAKGYIPADAFNTLLERTAFAISQEQSRYTLNGALLILKDGKARMIATDGHRLSLANVPLAEGELETLIPQGAIEYLASKAGKHGVCITAGEETIAFTMGNTQLITGKLKGQFPNYEAVMPRTFRLSMALSSPGVIAKTLARVSKCADERSGAVRWTLDTVAGPSLYAESTGTGTATAKLPAFVTPVVTETAGDNESGELETCLTIGLNSEYITQFLKIAGDQPVTMNLRDSQSAAMFSAYDEYKGYDWKYVVMPMRM